MSNFAVKLVLGREHYGKQYDIHDYLRDYSISGGWNILRVPEKQDWWMDVMFGYTTVFFNEYTAFKNFMLWFNVKTDYTVFELNTLGEYDTVEEVQ